MRRRFVRAAVLPTVAAVAGLVASVGVAWRSTHELGSSSTTTASPTSVAASSSTTTLAGSTTSSSAAPTTTTPDTTEGPTTTARTPSPVPEADVGVLADVLSLNQNARTGRSAAGLQALVDVMPSAFVPDPQGTPVINHDLLTDATASDTDPFTVTYTLDPRAVWSDGVAITCTDFYLAWMAGRGDVDKDGNRIFDSATTLGYADIGAITCSPDGRVVTVRFLRPSGGWPLLFSYLVPAHLVTTNAKVKDLVAADRKADPAVLARLGSAWVSLFAMDKVLPKNALVSGGPFTVTDWKKGARLTLSRNDKWWGDAARLQRVAFVVFTDPAKQLAALKAGQVQVITGPTDPATLGTTPDPNLVVAQGGAAAVEHVVFNLRNPFLQNRAIRRALARCIPRAAIVQALAAKGLSATTAPGSFLLTPDQPGYQDESVALTVVDDAQIAADLTKAGWTKGPDGLLQNAGKPVTLRVLGDGGPRSAIAVPQIVQACRAIGFDVVVDPVAAGRDARIASGDFDLALVNLPMRAEPSQVRTRYEATGVDNIGAYVSSTVTGQFAQLSAATAVADRTRLVVAIDQQLWQDAPSVPLDQPLGRVTRRATVDNLVRNPFTPGLGWQLTEWVLH